MTATKPTTPAPTAATNADTVTAADHQAGVGKALAEFARKAKAGKYEQPPRRRRRRGGKRIKGKAAQ